MAYHQLGQYQYRTRGRKRKAVSSYRRIKKYARFNPQMELKFFDVDKNQTPVSATGNITTSIVIIAQGVTESTRVGRKITVKKVNITFTVNLDQEQDQADIGGGDIIRVIVYCDKQANGADAAVTDILEDALYDSYRNLQNAKRFRIFKDFFMTINRVVAATDGASTSTSPLIFVPPVKVNISMDLPIEYSGVNGAITEMTSNNLAFLYISRNATGSITSSVRVRYTG